MKSSLFCFPTLPAYRCPSLSFLLILETSAWKLFLQYLSCLKSGDLYLHWSYVTKTQADHTEPYQAHTGALKVSSQLCRLSRTLILLNWWSLLSFLSVLLALLVSLLQLQTSHFQAIQPSGWAILGLNYFHKILSPAFLFFLFHELHEVSTLSNLHLPLSLLCCEATNWGAWLLVLLLVIIV